MAAKKKKKSRSAKKIHTVALSTGYAEGASISVLLLKHEVGFLTMKEVFKSLRKAVINAMKYGDSACTDDVLDIPKHWAVMDYWVLDELHTEDDAVHKYVYELIHGDEQSHGEFWEHVTNQGWLMNGPWLGRNLKDIHYVERAEDFIAEPEEYNGR